MNIDFTETKNIVIEEKEVITKGKDKGKEKVIAKHKFVIGLLDHRRFMNLNIAVAQGGEYGDLIYKYLPYFIVEAPGYEGKAEVTSDGTFKSRHILLDWPYRNIKPTVALPLFEKAMKWQSLSQKEVKNSSGRQGSPSKKSASKQEDAVTASSEPSENA